MSSCAEVVVLVEGPTEQLFVKQVLGPYMADRGVYLIPIILSKPGQNGGDVKFARAKNDIGKYLKQRSDTFVTLLIDYYGLHSDWPGYTESKQQKIHTKKADIINQATAAKVQEFFPEQNPTKRFISYISMHEIEALYFSDPICLADHMCVDQCHVDAILTECGEPEKINAHNTTAPSKRLAAMSGRFKKTSTGIAIATDIGIPKMRSACPLFNAWIENLESLARGGNDNA